MSVTQSEPTGTDPDATYHRVSPEQLRPSPGALALLTGHQARHLDCLPLVADGAKVVVVFASPPSASQIDQLAALTGRGVAPVLTDAAALADAMLTAYPPLTAAATASDRTSTAIAEGARVPDHLDELLEMVLAKNASDLHLAAGAVPAVRVHGRLMPLDDFAPLTGDVIERLVAPALTDGQQEAFARDLELDTSYTLAGRSRFRVNVFRQRNSVGAVLRAIPFDIPELDSLGMPPVVRTLADLPRGLVLVTGPTGSGKSTTLAALIDVINRSKQVHILSVEDPIEFLHTHRRAIVNQREVGLDTRSFASALKRALREDPDVILVGEMRDLETIQMALTAAETGHLVFATLHTQSAPQTVDRIVDVFPPEQQGQIRVMLSTTLQAVVTQQLVPTFDGRGRAVAAEVLVVTPAVRNLIREGKGHQIPTQMQAGAQYGMVTMDQSLVGLVRAGRITMAEALERAANADDLRNLLAERSGR